MKRVTLFLLLLAACSQTTMNVPTPVVTSTPEEKAGPSLSLEKTDLFPGEWFSVAFTAPQEYDKTAWVGIVPSGVEHGREELNDQNDVEYQYLQKRLRGVLQFEAPRTPGSYDLRMNDHDTRGQEVFSLTFTVRPHEGAAELKLSKTSFAPGEEIQVQFVLPASYPDDAWIGIVPSATEHGQEAIDDQANLAYQHLDGESSGALIFTAPEQPGSYDLRLNDGDDGGVETASISFTVE